MTITAQMVKDLRERTGAGMMDCKTALQETNGDLEAAVDWLRTKGLAKAAKKSGRVAAEGLIGIAEAGNRAAMVELNSETDFVSRNEQFQSLAKGISNAALTTDGNLDSVLGAKLSDGQPVERAITDAIATIGENMTLRRAAMLAVKEGVVASYVHAAIAPGTRQDRRYRRAGVDRRQGEARRAGQASRHACGGRQPLGGGRGSPRRGDGEA